MIESTNISDQIHLLNWVRAENQRPTPIENYNRIHHFGKWIQFKKTKGCFNVRAQVLIRDSIVPATSIDDEPCTIEKGEWNDSYTDMKIFDDNEVQIDHMVPLKEAYLAGGHEWSRAKRCVYANFLNEKDHLISTSNFENQSKADKTPEKYLPPKATYVCNYLKSWLKVKLIWKLSMQDSEADAIKKHIKDYNCKEADFNLTRADVKTTRKQIVNLESFCPVARMVKPKLKLSQPSLTNPSPGI